MTELLKGLGEYQAQEAQQDQEKLLGDNNAPHREARGTAASLKRDKIDEAAIETKEHTGSPIDNTINHEE